MNRAVIHYSESIYAFLVKFYPQWYREEFEDEMKFVFSESLIDVYRENGGRGIFTLWTRIMVDTGKSLVIQHFETLKGSDSMNTKSTNLLMQNKNILFVALVTGLLLLVPLVAMQFTSDVQWTVFDFVVAGGLLFSTGLAFELLTRRAGSLVYRAALGLMLATALFLVWANLAVGIIGTEDNPANWMYIGVLAVGLIGALIVRFRPDGMALVMFATALTQVLVTVIALVAQLDQDIPRILMVNGLFIVLWIGSALLFRREGDRLNLKG